MAPLIGELSAKLTERFRRPQFAGRLGLRCGVPPRQTQSDNIASSSPRLVGKNPTTASGPPPLIKGGEWLPCEGELSAKLTEGFLQRPVSYISNWSMWHGFTTGGLRTARPIKGRPRPTNLSGLLATSPMRGGLTTNELR